MSRMMVNNLCSDNVGISADNKKYIFGNMGSSGYVSITATSKLMVFNKTKMYNIDCNILLSNTSGSGTIYIDLYDRPFPTTYSNGVLVVCMNVVDGTYIALNGGPGTTNQTTIDNLVKPVTISDPITYIQGLIKSLTPSTTTTTSTAPDVVSYSYTKILVIILVLIFIVALISGFVGYNLHKK